MRMRHQASVIPADIAVLLTLILLFILSSSLFPSVMIVTVVTAETTAEVPQNACVVALDPAVVAVQLVGQVVAWLRCYQHCSSKSTQ